MRVAYFTESLYPHVDGVSKTLARLFDTLEDRQVDFRVFSPFVPPSGSVSWVGRVQRVPSFRFPPYPDYRVTIPRIRGVRAALRHFRPDLIHLVSPTPMAYRAQRLAARLAIPVVASFHTHFVSYFPYYGIGRLEGLGWSLLRRFYAGCERVYAPSRSIIRELGDHGIERLELWSRGIDLSGFSPQHRDPDRVRRVAGTAGVPVLLMVSRLVKEKDLATLVEVDRILRSRGVPFAFALVGDGPLRPKLQHALPYAFFAGHSVGTELASWYASADIFVFPSTTETFGNVVLEALASGLPTVVVDRGGPQDLVQHGHNGFIARSNDPADIARYLQRLLEDHRLREQMSEHARASAESRDWEEINGGLLASYERVIKEYRAPVRGS